MSYVGRFAPSPTGSLHLGSLVAAVGSWLDARRHDGAWLVRLEDLDTPRVVPGSADEILRTLAAFGMEPDRPVLRQSERLDAYGAALDCLRRQGHLFECSCSRRTLAEGGEQAYPGTCRSGPAAAGPTATRFRVRDDQEVRFEDRVQGAMAVTMRTLGDVVVRRRDGVFAYQLAVTVDDGAQGVTDVVRGADLLASTPWQIALQEALGLPRPRYAHLPLVVEPDGSKLAKSRRAVPLDADRAGPVLASALTLLGHPPPPELHGAPPRELLAWATPRWDPARLQGLRMVTLPA